jgi:L-fuconolactonase
MAEMIDAHHHLWRYDPREYGWIAPDMEVLQRDFLAEDLEHEARMAGIDGTIVVQARQTLTETEWLLDLAEEAECIRGVVGWLPLADAGVPALLRRYREHGKLKGLRHLVQDEPDDRFLLRADFNRGIEALSEIGLAYDILVHERHLPQTCAFVQLHPSQVFVLDHLAKPRIRAKSMQAWRDGLARLAECGNVYCKLSGLVTEADWENWKLDDLQPYLDAALRLFGAERLMAGSDWPVCLLASSYKRWWSALHEWCRCLTPAQRDCILGATARRAYRLD